VLYGSDWPLSSPATGDDTTAEPNSMFEQLAVGIDGSTAILHENARRLFG
jgi:predicted TIM-barrel fold metal-dependent hydrolase